VIPSEEIKEQARRNGVPESTVERDYAQGWLLAHVSTHLNMALKGGTGIRKVYLGDYRFSDDLDFTLLDDYTPDDIESRVKNAIRAAKTESGIDFAEAVKLTEADNGYQALTYFRLLRRTGSPLHIKLDLTLRDKEIILLPLEARTIIHPYSDALKAKALSYSLEEVFAEKIRSLFERTRPRDLYDVWRLSGHKLDVSRIIPDKLAFKGVSIDLDNLRARNEAYQKAWKSSLKHQLKDLPAFNAVLQEALILLKNVSDQSR